LVFVDNDNVNKKINLLVNQNKDGQSLLMELLKFKKEDITYIFNNKDLLVKISSGLSNFGKGADDCMWRKTTITYTTILINIIFELKKITKQNITPTDISNVLGLNNIIDLKNYIKSKELESMKLKNYLKYLSNYFKDIGIEDLSNINEENFERHGYTIMTVTEKFSTLSSILNYDVSNFSLENLKKDIKHKEKIKNF
jgi:hypothetical protein